VALGFDEVVDRVSRHRWQFERILEQAARRLVDKDGGAAVSVSVGAATPVSGSSAWLPVAWTVGAGSDPGARSGRATLAILVVQSGRDPLTELLLAIDVEEQHHQAMATTLHAILEGVTDWMSPPLGADERATAPAGR
jgi:hypothetical protein